MTDESASILGFTDAPSSTTVEEALLKLAGKFIVRLQVLVDGVPAISGVVVNGLSEIPNSGKSANVTDENGIIYGTISASGGTLTSRNYIDLPSKSLTIASTEIKPVTNITLELNRIASGTRKTITSSQTVYVSPYDANADIAIIGGGGGGSAAAIGGYASNSDGDGYTGIISGGGGGGGHVSNFYNVNITNKEYTVTIGAGGTCGNGATGNTYNSGSSGGTTTVSSVGSAAGGGGGNPGSITSAGRSMTFNSNSSGGVGNGNGAPGYGRAYEWWGGEAASWKLNPTTNATEPTELVFGTEKIAGGGGSGGYLDNLSGSPGSGTAKTYGRGGPGQGATFVNQNRNGMSNTHTLTTVNGGNGAVIMIITTDQAAS